MNHFIISYCFFTEKGVVIGSFVHHTKDVFWNGQEISENIKSTRPELDVTPVIINSIKLNDEEYGAYSKEEQP